MSAWDLVIFDYDGVLSSASRYFLQKAYEEAYGICFKNAQEFNDFWNPNWRENESELQKRSPFADITKRHEVFYQVYDCCCELLPWVERLLQGLSSRCCLAVMTNRHLSTDGGFGKKLGNILHAFSYVIGAENVVKLKPDPEGINIILEQARIKKEQKDKVLFVGDMPDDVIAGKRAGIKTAMAIWEYGLGQEKHLGELKKDGFPPDFVFRNEKDFFRFLL